MKQRVKALGGAVMVVGAALLPALGALFQLGVELEMVARMHAASAGPPTMEPIATYVVDPSTGQASMRIHSAVVRR